MTCDSAVEQRRRGGNLGSGSVAHDHPPQLRCWRSAAALGTARSRRSAARGEGDFLASVDEPLQQSRAQPAVVARAAPRPRGVLHVRPPPPPRLSSLSGPSPGARRRDEDDYCAPPAVLLPTVSTPRNERALRGLTPLSESTAPAFSCAVGNRSPRGRRCGPAANPCRGGVPRPGNGRDEAEDSPKD